MNALTKTMLSLGSMMAVQRATSAIREVTLNDVLGVVGLAQRRSSFDKTLPAIGLVAFGAALGAGAALIFAPSSGAELRSRLSDRVDDAKGRLQDASSRLEERVESVVERKLSSLGISGNRSTTHS